MTIHTRSAATSSSLGHRPRLTQHLLSDRRSGGRPIRRGRCVEYPTSSTSTTAPTPQATTSSAPPSNPPPPPPIPPPPPPPPTPTPPRSSPGTSGPGAEAPTQCLISPLSIRPSAPS